MIRLYFAPHYKTTDYIPMITDQKKHANNIQNMKHAFKMLDPPNQ